MSAKLVAEEGSLKGLVLSLDGGDYWVIGRDPDACQLLIEDSSASRRHAICRTTPEGIVIENLSDTNPVKVNAEVISEPKLLQNGDALNIGSGLFRFYEVTSAEVIRDEKETNGTKLEGIAMNKALQDSPLEDDHKENDSIFVEEEQHGEKQMLAEIDFNIMETGRWLLKVIAGANNGAEFSMQPSTTYLVGTDPNTCDIVFHDTSVSRQHAKISISANDELTIEDLKSRNGTLLDGEPLTGKKTLQPNTIVVVGTTAFVVFNREGEMHTVISPLLPSIVKSLQKEEEKKVEAAPSPPLPVAPVAQEVVKEAVKEKPIKHSSMGGFILIGIIAGIFAIVGVGTFSLFKNAPIIVEEPVDTSKKLDDALALFPSVKYSFNKTTGKLLLIGHVLSASDKNQILYNLQGLPFIKSIDDTGIIIDEFVRQEVNPLLTKNPNWKGVSIQNPKAGQFVLYGYLNSRKQAEALSDYVSTIFPYMDLLENHLVVEEEIVNSVNNILNKAGIKSIKTTVSNGEVVLSGGIPTNKTGEIEGVLGEIKQIQGVRSINNQIASMAPERAMNDISDKYDVTGVSNLGGKISVIINGRILSKRDVLDGMTITEIKSGTIFLEKEGVKYRIDFGG